MARLPSVICPGCNQSFYREDEPDNIHEGRRYWHKKCYDEKQKYNEYYNMIHEYCKNKYGKKYFKTRIDTQIKELLEDGKTISGIYRSLIYWYEVKEGDVEKSHGSIRIINYIYDEAMEYYDQKFRLQAQQAKLEKGCLDLGTETFYISPTPIKRPKRVKLFDIR